MNADSSFYSSAPSGISRRHFLAGAIGLAASLGHAKAAPLADIVVIGAGMAGLHAAWQLEQRGFRVTVLEAQPRIGGRNWTLRHGDFVPDVHGETQRCEFSPGQQFDAGAWRLLPTHRRMHALADQLGIPLHLVDAASGGAAPREGMDCFAWGLAQRLARTPLTDCMVSQLTIDKDTQRVHITCLHKGQAQTREAHYALVALPLNRLRALNLALPGIPVEIADALKVAHEIAQFPEAPTISTTSTSAHWRLIWPAPDSGQRIVSVYANQLALREEFTDTRTEQIRRAATKLPESLQISHPLAIQWSRIPHQQAAASQVLSRASQQLLRQGKPPLFFASDALSSLNGWQEGALESAEHAVQRLWLHWSARRKQ